MQPDLHCRTLAAHTLKHFRALSPLTHCMTNDVVQTFTANTLLALGASPAMVIDPVEARPFAAIANALLINVGTLTASRADAMRAAVESAYDAKTPWTLDPVAVGALEFRRRFCLDLLSLRPAAIRGNASEILALSCMAQVNKQAIAAAFGRAASQYEQHASLQQHIADALQTLLTGRQFASVLDAGCGPGRMSRYWRERGSEVTALDLSLPMLQQARDRQAAHHYLLADIEAIPHDAEVFDLAWSNLAVQWCGDLRDALSELYRVVRPGGVVAFTTLCQGSLPELRQAWQAVDNRAHANSFLPEEAIDHALRGWRAFRHTQAMTLWFEDALSAMRSLKGIGATHLHEGRESDVLTRARLRQIQLAWPQRQGKYPLTYHLFMGVIERD